MSSVLNNSQLPNRNYMNTQVLLSPNLFSSPDERQDIPAPRQETTGIRHPENFTGEGLLTPHPWFDGIETHLLTTCAMLRASTIGEKRRKLYHIGRVFESLQKGTPEFTTDPGKMTQKEIVAFINWMRDNSMDPATQRKYLQMIRDYCLFYDNAVVQKMKIIYKSSWPRAIKKPISALNIHQINQIIEFVQDWKGWWGDVARFVCVIYPHIGTRPTELRTMLFKDLNRDLMKVTVSNPKGAGIYAIPREIEIDDYYKEVIDIFLQARQDYLNKYSAESKYLIPYCFMSGPHQGNADCWSSGNWSKLAKRIKARSDIDFSWKDYRSSCVDIDKNIYKMDIEDVSRKLGHSSVLTTETFYGRLQMGEAMNNRKACLSEAKRAGVLAIIPLPDGKVKNQSGPKEI